MRVHHLKIWPSQFRATLSGEKVHEWRKNDRDFEKGDHLALHEFDPAKPDYGHGFSGRILRVLVTHITTAFGVPAGWCVMSTRKLGELEYECPQCGEPEPAVMETGAIACAGCGYEFVPAAPEPLPPPPDPPPAPIAS